MATDYECKGIQKAVTELICMSCDFSPMCSRKTVFRFDGVCSKIGIKLKVEPWELNNKAEGSE